jgi:hypothetical protein
MQATLKLLAVLKRHLSYKELVKFNIQIPFLGSHHNVLVWLPHKIMEVDPTSIGAQGRYAGEQFRWNGWFKRYEIMLDDLGLNDLGLLEEES